MYLFEENNKKIEVFSFDPNPKLVTEYRKEQLDRYIPKHERIYYAQSTTSDKPLIEHDTLDWRELNYRYPTSHPSLVCPMHKFMAGIMGSKETIIDQYINGAFNNKRVIKYSDLNGNMHYFLLTRNKYRKIYGKYYNSFVMDGIIHIPQSLFLLEMFIRGEFERVKGDDISSELTLFDLSKNCIASLDKYTMEQIDFLRLISTNDGQLMDKVKITEPVLKLARQKSNLI